MRTPAGEIQPPPAVGPAPPGSLDVAMLGCERSGTTWLTNIFDSHPAVECMLEPWAPYAELFPGFPQRHVYVGAPGGDLIAATARDYMRLPRAKYPLFYRPSAAHWLRALDRRAARTHSWAARALRMPRPIWEARHDLLNLNQRDVAVRDQPRKTSTLVRVVKELRLNMKIPLLARLWPDATYIVCIRHPAAQLESVLRHFQRGQLNELRLSLPAFLSGVREQARLQPYWRALELCGDAPGEPLRTLALWWLINYDVLLDDLERCGLSHRVVRHEDLSREPINLVGEVFAMSGLEMVDATRDYILSSSSTPPPSASPTETTRVSREHSVQSIKEADQRILEAVRDLAFATSGTKPISPAISRYIDPDSTLGS